MFSKLTELVENSDLFARPVSLSFKGRSSHKSICGGLVSILVVLGVVIESCFTLRGLIKEPNYNQYPTTFDYDYDRNITLNLVENMVSYKLLSKFKVSGQKDLYGSLRVVFADENGSVPTVYCTDFFAKQIAAEASG